MRVYSVVSAALGGIFMVSASATALAGSFGSNCGGNAVCSSGFNQSVLPYEGVRNAACNQRPAMGVMPTNKCGAGVVNHAIAADPWAPVNNYSTAPYGYLKSFAYKNTPNVNVMRVYTNGPRVALNDVPTGFTGGCNPVSTGYCRAGSAMPMPAPRPVMRPVFPAPRPVLVQAPIMRAPVQIRTGRGYNPANFAPRQYGNNVLTPGIAHIPTSIVDRSPITHIGGVPQQRVSSVTTVNGTYGPGFNSPRAVMAPRQMGGNVIGHVSGGSYTYKTPGTPDYWEKTSGATVVDGLPATQILCRRAGTAGTTRTVNVVRPVIGVPQPVPVPVAVRVPASPACGPTGLAPRSMSQRVMSQRPVAMAGGRWTY